MVGTECQQGRRCGRWTASSRTRGQETGTVYKGLARTKRLKTHKLVVRKRLIVFARTRTVYRVSPEYLSRMVLDQREMVG